MGVELFRVLAASGGFVNGIEVAIGADIPLTEAEARYEIDAGTVARTGQVPVLPIVPAVLPTDLVPTTRGALPRLVPMASLETYLAGEDSLLSRALAARGDAIGAHVVGEVEAALAVLRGDASADADTLGKLAGLIEHERARLDAILHGSVADLDTFLEAYNRFVAGDDAAAAVTAALASLRAAFDGVTADTAAVLRVKADLDANGKVLAEQIGRATVEQAQAATDDAVTLTPYTGFAMLLAKLATAPFLGTAEAFARTLAERAADVTNVKGQGAKGDGREASLAVALAVGSVLATVPAGTFSTDDIGKSIEFAGGGTSAGRPFRTTIAAVPSTTTVQLAAAPATPVSASVNVIWGSDDTAAFIRAQTVAALRGTPIYVPSGFYVLTRGISGLTQPIFGDGRFTTTIRGSFLNAGHTLAALNGISQWGVRGIKVDGSGPGAHCVSASGCSRLDICENFFTRSGTGGAGFYTFNTTYLRAIGNYGTLTGAAGITAGVASALIDGNFFVDTGGSGITCYSYLADGVAGANGEIQISNNKSTGAGYVVPQDNITGYDDIGVKFRIVNNICDDAGNHNIHVGAQDLELSSNTCTRARFNNIIVSTRIAGTPTTGTTKGAIVARNVCIGSGPGYPNIVTDGNSWISVNDNTCRFAGGVGIASSNGLYVSITKNRIERPASHGIRTAGLLYSHVADNQIELVGIDEDPNPLAFCISNSAYTKADGTPSPSTQLVISRNIMVGGRAAFVNGDATARCIVNDNESSNALNQTQPFILGPLDTERGNRSGARHRSEKWGYFNIANADWSHAAGTGAHVNGRVGFHARASGIFTASGDAQAGLQTFMAKSDAGNNARLSADGVTLSSSTACGMVANSAMVFRGDVVAINAARETKAWSVIVHAVFDGTTLTVVGSAITVLYATSGATSWTMTANSNNGLRAPLFNVSAPGVQVAANLTTTECRAPVAA